MCGLEAAIAGTTVPQKKEPGHLSNPSKTLRLAPLLVVPPASRVSDLAFFRQQTPKKPLSVPARPLSEFDDRVPGVRTSRRSTPLEARIVFVVAKAMTYKHAGEHQLK